VPTLTPRQIPYTMAKFACFEKIVELFYGHVFTAPKESYSKTTQLGVTFASGYSAGVVCAIVSHPADSLVSLQGKASNKGKSLGTIASETGLGTLMTKGLGTRVLMIGEMTAARPSADVVADHGEHFQVPSLVSSGGSTTRSRPPWVSARLAASKCWPLWSWAGSRTFAASSSTSFIPSRGVVIDFRCSRILSAGVPFCSGAVVVGIPVPPCSPSLVVTD
jgi:hypothetical protein